MIMMMLILMVIIIIIIILNYTVIRGGDIALLDGVEI